MSIFSGHSLQDLRDLWKAQPLATYTGPVCVTYTGQPPEPVQPVAQGWQCPICKAVLSPHVDRCANCSPQTTRAYSTTTAVEWSNVMELD